MQLVSEYTVLTSNIMFSQLTFPANLLASKNSIINKYQENVNQYI